MRRLKILFYWIFVNRNNIGFTELVRFLLKPTVGRIAEKYIKSIEPQGECYQVAFNGTNNTMLWPKSFSIAMLHQVTAETFDENDWHYYRKEHTEIAPGEILLDIGTAEGLFPAAVIDQCEKVYMVEPSTLFYNCLKQTFSSYNGKAVIFNTAVGDHDGKIYFEENSLEGMVSFEANDASREMPIHKIDTLLANGENITYLKADIEGFEEDMLRGAEQTIRRNKPKIAITCYHTQNNPEEIISIVKGFVPEYKHYVKGIYGPTPKPVMIHFWV